MTSYAPTRRGFLTAAAALAGAAVVPTSVWRAAPVSAASPFILKPTPPAYFTDFGTNAEMRWASVDPQRYLTPQSRLFVRNHTRTPQVDRSTYALRVHGDSMISDTNDSFPDGSILIVEPDMEAQPGDYVIAKNAEGKTTFKQLVKDEGEYFLRPLNPRHVTHALGDAEVIGVVREFTKRFR